MGFGIRTNFSAASMIYMVLSATGSDTSTGGTYLSPQLLELLPLMLLGEEI